MTDKEAMQMALETLDNMVKVDWREWDEFASVEDFVRWAKSRASFTAEALRARLSQPEPAECDGGQCGIGGYCKQCPKTHPEQEPTAYLCENAVGHKYFRWKKPSSEYKPIALYTAHASPQRIWQNLTDEEVVVRANAEVFAEAFARGVAWAELKLKEKNT